MPFFVCAPPDGGCSGQCTGAYQSCVGEAGCLAGRSLFVSFLPTYSPHLNIAEVLWRKMKYEWLRPEDYADKDALHLAVWQALMAAGQSLNIQFSASRQNSLT